MCGYPGLSTLTAKTVISNRPWSSMLRKFYLIGPTKSCTSRRPLNLHSIADGRVIAGLALARDLHP